MILIHLNNFPHSRHWSDKVRSVFKLDFDLRISLAFEPLEAFTIKMRPAEALLTQWVDLFIYNRNSVKGALKLYFL